MREIRALGGAAQWRDDETCVTPGERDKSLRGDELARGLTACRGPRGVAAAYALSDSTAPASQVSMPEGASRSVVRFGDFELDLRSRELRRRGVKIALQERPLQVLEVLLRTPGELVTRETLQHELWGGDTFVDFETGLNAAVRRLREALGDAAGVPRFVETLPRRGYRFIGPVQGVEPPAPHMPEHAAPAATAPSVPPRSTWKLAGRYLVALVAIAAVIVVGGAMALSRWVGSPERAAATPQCWRGSRRRPATGPASRPRR